MLLRRWSLGIVAQQQRGTLRALARCSTGRRTQGFHHRQHRSSFSSLSSSWSAYSTARTLSSLAADTNAHNNPNLNTVSPGSILDDLPSSFKRTKKQSAVSLGTSFEMHSLHTLNQHFSMDLRRVGGKDDGGVDLVGWWWVPDVCRGTGDGATGSELGRGAAAESDGAGAGLGSGGKRRRIRVIAQCKAEKKKMGPGRVRELEGVVFRLASESGGGPGGHQGYRVDDSEALAEGANGDEGIGGVGRTPIVALLISSSPFTKAAVLRAHSSPIPMFLLHLPFEGHLSSLNLDTITPETSVATNAEGASAIWNQALSGSGGVLGGDLEVRWERHLASGMVAGGQGSMTPILWWKGRGRLGSLVP
jgi:Protein of unknown function (DUF2034)